MEKISWSDHVKNDEVLHRVKGERNIIHTIKLRKASRVGHVLVGTAFEETLLKEK